MSSDHSLAVDPIGDTTSDNVKQAKTEATEVQHENRLSEGDSNIHSPIPQPLPAPTASEEGDREEEEVKEEINVEDEESDNEYSDDFEDESGDETDIEDNDELVNSFPFMRRRKSNPELPATTTVLETKDGSKVYLVGTCHFSIESQDDVSKTIQETQPDVVMVELCQNRISILDMDEEALLRETKNINLEKIRFLIKQHGLVQGVTQLLFLSMSAHITKELGMAPGGEFRRAFREAQKIPGCRLQLGDRPISVTFQRALASLSVWQKLRLSWHLLMSKDPISKSDVEKCKQKDLMEEILREMTGEFPGLSRVFIQERDSFLAYSLKNSAQAVMHSDSSSSYIPMVVVGVVGIGHVPGIVANWKNEDYDIKEIMTVPKGGMLGKLIKLGFRLSLIGVVSVACYKLFKWTVPLIT